MPDELPMELTPTQLQADLDRHGFAMLGEFVDADELTALAQNLESKLENSRDSSVLRSRGKMYGSRNLLATFPDAANLLKSPALLELITSVIGPDAGLVRALYFDKPPGRTWSLPWHKDRTIAVARNDRPSKQFRNPTVKAGIPHVEAPESVLTEMLTLRIHVDPMTTENGPLSVIPGSHRSNHKATNAPVQLRANAGDILAMRPLLSHSSSMSSPNTNSHRRVIHFELSPHAELPDGYKWHTFTQLR